MKAALISSLPHQGMKVEGMERQVAMETVPVSLLFSLCIFKVMEEGLSLWKLPPVVILQKVTEHSPTVTTTT